MRKLILLILTMTLIGAGAAGLGGCSVNSSDHSRMDRAMKAMDEGRYAQAQDILQAELQRHPGDSQTMVLLAEADLGLAGIQIMDFIDEISRPQPAGAGLDLVAAPNCDPGKISNLRGADIRCVLLRMVEHLPDPEDPNFSAARDLLRRAYPDPKAAPLNVNFISSVVELGSAMGRAKLLLDQTAWFDANGGRQLDRGSFHFVVHHLKNEFIELMNGLRRVRYSYQKLSQYVVNLDGKPVIRVGDQELVFSEDLDLPAVLRFSGAVIDRYQGGVNEKLDQALSMGFNRLPLATILVMERLDRIYSLGFFTDDILVPALSFDREVNKLLSILSEDDPSKSRDFDLLALIWHHPPAILKSFPPAFSQAWDMEQIDPLNQYYQRSREQWFAFKELVADWNEWTSRNLKMGDEERISAYLRQQQRIDPRLSLPPAELTDSALKSWQTRISAAMQEHLTQVLQSQDPGLPVFTPAQQASGLELLDRTIAWVQANLWTVD